MSIVLFISPLFSIHAAKISPQEIHNIPGLYLGLERSPLVEMHFNFTSKKNQIVLKLSQIANAVLKIGVDLTVLCLSSLCSSSSSNFILKS